MSLRPALPAVLRRPITLVVLTLTVLALLAGSAAYALTAKTVSLAVDGEVTEVAAAPGAQVAEGARLIVLAKVDEG